MKDVPIFNKQKLLTMRTKQILSNIAENGGFDNFRNWNYQDKIEWVIANYHCSKYVAKNVAIQL